MSRSSRRYIVLKMNQNGGDPMFAYKGEIEATTHMVAKNKAQDKYNLRDRDLGMKEGLVVVPKRSWHTYL